MQSIVDYLFGSAAFIPHGFCLAWRPDLVALHGIADGLIAVSYFSIPVALMIFLKRRNDLAFRGVFALFALFIFACGMTHIAALVTLWEPYYGLQGLIKLATAVVSVTTAVMLWPLIPKAMALPSPGSLALVNGRLEEEIAERRSIQAELRRGNELLELRVAERTAALEQANHRLTRELAERASLEAAHRDSEAQLRAVFDTAVDGLVVIDGGGTVQSYNRACEALFGHAAPQVIGQNVKMLMPEPYRSEHDGYIEHYRRTGERRIIGIGREVVGLRKDGTTFPMELSVGEARRGVEPIFVGIIRDITGRQAAAQALEQKAAELLNKNAELEDFAYVASHDLQEPLRMIAGYCELLRKRYGGKLDSDADEFLEFAVNGATRMQALILDLLRLARLSKHELVRQPVDCNAVLEQVRGDLKAAIDDSKAEVTSDPLPEIAGDATQIGQLLLNLVGNAIKFQGDEAPRVQISAEESATEWRFAVQDNGIGIEPQYYQKIFTLFRRLHGHEAYPGTGIGLSICKKIVERHGGRIWIDPAVQSGTRFCFTISKGH